MLTREEIEVAAKRAETYPKGVEPDNWGTGAWRNLPYDGDEANDYLREHPGIVRFG